jgi:hypothetical protein
MPNPEMMLSSDTSAKALEADKHVKYASYWLEATCDAVKAGEKTKIGQFLRKDIANLKKVIAKAEKILQDDE